MKGRWYSILVGGVAFWLPGIVIFAIFQDRSPLLLNVAPFLGLFALAIIDWIALKRTLRWNWVLAGLYILGPISIWTEGWFAGAVPPWKQSLASMFFELATCLFPPMTILLSFYSLQFFSVLAASIALPVFAIFERGRGLRSLL
jgi:hypothetical protein